MVVSKFEENCRMIFEIIFDKQFRSCRPQFLRNPRTGRCLELDGFCPELKIAFEAQGEQHYMHSKMKGFASGGDVDDKFLQRILYDKFKREACKKVGIKLYEINYESGLVPLIFIICRKIGGIDTPKTKQLLKKVAKELNRRYQLSNEEVEFILK